MDLKVATVLQKAKTLREEGEKGQILNELSALLLTMPCTRKRARAYVERAIDYISKH